MALGPKEMGDAIAANLKTKTGKDLEQWLKTAEGSKITDKKELTAFLKEQGLGQFQAQTVTARFLGTAGYENPAKMIDDVFAKFPDQKGLMEAINEKILQRYGLRVKPCKGYIPLYGSEGKIALSYKPTSRGLYIGLIGEDFPFETIPHKRSLGGSERMTQGILVHDAKTAAGKLRLYLDALPGKRVSAGRSPGTV